MIAARTAHTIKASVNDVFNVISDAHEFYAGMPDANVYFLTSQEEGVGTRVFVSRFFGRGGGSSGGDGRRRYFFSKRHSFQLEITSWERNRHIRFIKANGFDQWDYLLMVGPDHRGGTMLVIEARAYNCLAKLMAFVHKRVIHRELDRDILRIKDYLESNPEIRKRRRQRQEIVQMS